jgi:hypothetical protein
MFEQEFEFEILVKVLKKSKNREECERDFDFWRAEFEQKSRRVRAKKNNA